MSRIKEIRARDQEATRGPWHIFESAKDIYSVWDMFHKLAGHCELPDAEFIADSREDIPFLLEENERKDAKISRLTAEVEQLKAVIEEAAEEYENGYGHETELSKK